MIKQVLIKCAELVNRDDILTALKNSDSIDDITNSSLQNEVTRLIKYYNFVIHNIYENYLQSEELETLTSDENNRIYFSNFKRTPVRILTVRTTTNQNTLYKIQSNFISTNAAFCNYDIEYYYTPNDIKDLNEEISVPYNLSKKTICYGIVSEFLASKDQFEKSEYWKNKFLYDLFKIKTKKERKIKLTF